MGLPIINEINPSEWGTLKLVKRGRTTALPVLVIAGLLILVIIIKRKKTQKRELPASHFQSMVNKYLEENYTNLNLSVKDIADHLSLNKDYFGQKFKQEFKQFFPDFLNRFRLEKAKIQLKETNLPVLDISIMVGFKSSENFARLFKKHFGHTPTEFRQLSANL
jgi:AraC-like DNA-binding protein